MKQNILLCASNPFGMLIEHLLDLGEDEAANELGVGDLDSFYKQARETEKAREREREQRNLDNQFASIVWFPR